MEVRNNRVVVPLSPIRRTLFGAKTPPAIEIKSPNSTGNVTQFKTPQLSRRTSATPKRSQTPYEHFEAVNHISSPHLSNENGTTPNMHSVLEETFTVMSILKELKMEKYASLFAREEVDLLVFLMLDADDMNEIGIDTADQPIIMNAIQCFTEFFGTPDKMCR